MMRKFLLLFIFIVTSTLTLRAQQFELTEILNLRNKVLGEVQSALNKNEYYFSKKEAGIYIFVKNTVLGQYQVKLSFNKNQKLSVVSYQELSGNWQRIANQLAQQDFYFDIGMNGNSQPIKYTQFFYPSIGSISNFINKEKKLSCTIIRSFQLENVLSITIGNK